MSLVKRARAAEEGVDRVSDDHGHSALIERDPAVPGALRVTLEGFEHPRIEEQWILPAADRPPAFHPADIPFLAGFACRIMRGGGHLIAVWRDDACPRPDPETMDALMASAPDEIRELAGASSDRMKREGGGEWLREAAAGLRERLSREDAVEWLGSLAAAADPDPRYVDAWVHVMEATLFDGWTKVVGEKPVGFAVRSLLASKDDRRRLITLSGMMGQTTLTLMEGPADRVAPPPPVGLS
ncbi:MAG TPA: hypothetical protein VGA70_05815 [Longimicrobiales bacterium]